MLAVVKGRVVTKMAEKKPKSCAQVTRRRANKSLEARKRREGDPGSNEDRTGVRRPPDGSRQAPQRSKPLSLDGGVAFEMQKSQPLIPSPASNPTQSLFSSALLFFFSLPGLTSSATDDLQAANAGGLVTRAALKALEKKLSSQPGHRLSPQRLPLALQPPSLWLAASARKAFSTPRDLFSPNSLLATTKDQAGGAFLAP